MYKMNTTINQNCSLEEREYFINSSVSTLQEFKKQTKQRNVSQRSAEKEKTRISSTNSKYKKGKTFK